MNYAEHEKLRVEVAEVANAMSDLRGRLNDMEHRVALIPMCLLNACHARRCIAPTACLWKCIPEILELDACFKD